MVPEQKERDTRGKIMYQNSVNSPILHPINRKLDAHALAVVQEQLPGFNRRQIGIAALSRAMTGLCLCVQEADGTVATADIKMGAETRHWGRQAARDFLWCVGLNHKKAGEGKCLKRFTNANVHTVNVRTNTRTNYAIGKSIY